MTGTHTGGSRIPDYAVCIQHVDRGRVGDSGRLGADYFWVTFLAAAFFAGAFLYAAFFSPERPSAERPSWPEQPS